MVRFILSVFISLLFTLINLSAQSPNCGDAEEISCETSSSGDLRTEDNNFSRSHYSNCANFSASQHFNGGDKIYRFTKNNASEVITIRLDHGNNTNLSLFVMTCNSDTDVSAVTCIGRGQNFPNSNHPQGEEWSDNGALDAGDYYIIIDAVFVNREAPFTLSLECSGECDDVEQIYCGETINATTSGQINNYHADDYNNCHSSNRSFNGLDRVFKFERYSSTDINYITLWRNNAHEDLDIFVFDACDGTCIAKSTNPSSSFGRNVEVISLRDYPEGEYFIIVDGPSTNHAGSFNLSLSCEGLYCEDAISLECNIPVDGDNSGLYNASSAYTGNCVEASWSSRDFYLG